MRDWSVLPGILGPENWMASLPDPVRGEILERMTPIHLRAGDVLKPIGAATVGLYRIESGYLRLVATHSDGRQTLIVLYRPGNCLGEAPLVADRPAQHLTMAMTEARVSFLPAEAFWMLYRRYPEIPEALCRKFADAMNRLLAGRKLSATRRLRRLIALAFCNLTDLAGRQELDGSVTIEPPLTQNDLADHFGVTRQAVQREIGALKRLGVVAKRDGLWRVLDIAALERLSA